MARLLVNVGSPGVMSFELEAGPNYLGRAQDNAVSIPHRGLSRHHACIEVHGPSAHVKDLGSKNGVSIDGERITNAVLESGQTFFCGDLPLTFIADGELPAPALVMQVDPARNRTRADLGQLLTEAGLGPSARRRAELSASQTSERLRVLLRIGELLSSPATLDVVLDRILDLAFQILPLDHGAILLRPESRDSAPRLPAVGDEADAVPVVVPPAPLVVRASRSRHGHVAGHVHSRAVVAEVMRSGYTALFSDLRIDPRVSSSDSIAAQSICACMCATLRPRDELIGVIYVDNRSGADVFGGADLEFLEAFANSAALAIDNSRLRERLEREAVVRSQLLRFFPPSTAARVAEGGSASLPIVETEVTALFCDICDFTGLSSNMLPRQVVELLNAYFDRISEIVFRHEGTLEKYIGDALLAVWGAPFSRADDADRAVLAAIEIQGALTALNQEARALGRPEIALHIGVNTGPVAAGNVGSKRYLQYATVGDATNVASRICDVADAGEILIAEQTRARLTPDRFTLESRGEVALRGKDRAMPLYRVLREG